MVIIVFAMHISCEKINVAQGTPSCIKQEIKDHASVHAVYRYLWMGEQVYYFEDNSYPGSFLLNGNCDCMCEGGYISGWQSDPCKSFFDERENELEIWRK